MIVRMLSALLALLLVGAVARADVGSPALIWSTDGAPYEINTGIYMVVDPDSCPGIDSSVTEYQYKRYDNYVTGIPVPAFVSAWQGDDGIGNNYLDTAVVAQPPATRHNYKACCRSNVTQTGGGCTQIDPLLNSMDGIGYGPPYVFITGNRLPKTLGPTTIRARTQIGIPHPYEHQFPFQYRWLWGKLSDPVESWATSTPVSTNWRDFTSADGIQINNWYCFKSDTIDQAGNATGYATAQTIESLGGYEIVNGAFVSLWPDWALCALVGNVSRTETLRWTQAASPAAISGYEVEFGRTTWLGTTQSITNPGLSGGIYSKGITVPNAVTLHFVLRAKSNDPTPNRVSANSNMITRPF